jgi:glycosyltransferase involved in cell wall biosynthesis
MHDMWAMTAGCHYTYGCDKYLTQCSRCPQLNSHFKYDIAYLNFYLKKFLLRNLKIHVVCCSNWLANCFKKSHLFKNAHIEVIPNPIDLNIFSPKNKLAARDILDLPRDKKIILLSALSAATDSRKGIQFLSPMFKLLEEHYSPNDLLILVAGSSHDHGSLQTNFEKKFLGQLNDDVTLSMIYSAADISIAPSTQENLSNSVMESISCGTPVLAFNIGGMSDLIIPSKTGELAVPFNVDDLSERAREMLEKPEGFYRDGCIEHVKQNYSPDIVVTKYIELYKKISSH